MKSSASPGGLKKGYLSMVILFLAPAFILYAVLFLLPSAESFYISLFDWNGFTSNMKFVGLGNFKELFKDNSFWSVAFYNTIRIMFAGGIIAFTIAFVFSGILSTRIKGKRFFRGLLFFPAVINPVAVAILWSFIFNSQWGLLNSILDAIGLAAAKQVWTEPGKQFWVLLLSLIWMNTGYYCVILLAGLDQVPETHIEAAHLEGASQLTIFFKIKLPLIRNIVGTAITLWCINAVKEFALFFSWSGGISVPPNDATNLAVKMYVTAFGRRITIFRMGYATTMGIIMFAVVAITIFVVDRIFKTKDLEY